MAAGDDGHARIFNADTQMWIGDMLKSSTWPIGGAAFSPNGRTVVTGNSNGNVQMWNVTNPAKPTPIGKPFYSAGPGISSVAFSANGRKLVFAYGSNADVWDTRTPPKPPKYDSTIEESGTTLIKDAALSPDGTLAITGGTNGLAHVWPASSANLPTGTITQPLLTLGGHTGTIESADFGSRGDEVITSAGDGTAKIWDPAPIEQRQLLRGNDTVQTVAFSPVNPNIAATMTIKGTATVWDLRRDRALAVLHNPTSGFGGSAEFSHDGQLLVTTAGTEQARIWNLSDPTKPLEVLDARHGSMCNPNKASLNSYTAGFDSAVFSRDRTHVATSDYDRSACVWTLAGKTYRPTLFIREPPGATNGIGIYEGGSAPVRWADISPDGKRLLIASEDGTARILSMADRAALRVLADPTGQPINDAWFSHDGQLVVTASNGGTVGIWNASTGVEEQQIVEPDRSQVYNAAFSPDDTLVVTCGGTAHIFRIKDSRGSLLQNPQRLTDFQYGGDISDCEFSPNGTLIATGGQQGNTRIFSTELDGSLQYVEALARARVSRQLTAAEKKQYGIS